MNKEFKLSASRWKTYKSCSLKYAYQYLYKIPQKPNEGATTGSIAHIAFECLVNPRHNDILNSLINSDNIIKTPIIERFVRKHCKQNKLEESSYNKIDKFIITGAKSDFLCKEKGGELIGSEINFDIKNDKWRAVGFIDQVAKYPQNFIRLRDWKSQKKEFDGEDRTENIQAYIYTLAAKELYGQDIKVVVDFMMLNFPDDPIFRVKPTEEGLEKFKEKLTYYYEKIENFTEKDIFSNVAKNQGFPKPGEGFKGCLLCGRKGKSFVSSPTERKKNGELMYSCSFRFPFSYFALCDEDGNVLRSSLENDLKMDKAGQFIIKKNFGGCQAFKK